MPDRVRIAIKTLGCKLNQYESEGIQEALEAAGFTVVPFSPDADVYIINTCTVTGKTDRRSRKTTRQILGKNPDARIIVTGCAAQRNGRDFSDIPGVRAVIGNREKNRITDYVPRVLENETPIYETADLRNAPFERLSISGFRDYTRAFLKIQEGCDHPCSYCVVPSVRGHSRSQEPRIVINDILQLSERGYQEIVLTGIDLGSYGKDLKPRTDLVSLLTAIERIPGIGRIRLSSIEPMEFSRDLVQFLAASRKICRHYHIPLQSADNRILDRMNRAYTVETYSELLHDIKSASPDTCIGADVITGFPGETDRDFAGACAAIERLPLDYLHVFSYSDRSGTASCMYSDKNATETIRRRSRVLREMSSRKAVEFRKRLTGKTLPSVVLSVPDKMTGLPQALSDNYIRVLITGSEPPGGTLVGIRLETVDGMQCCGRVMDQ